MTTLHGLERARTEGMLFGIPLGELGFFQTLLMSFAAAFIAFFGATFLGIVALLAYMTATNKHPDFAVTYKYGGLPLGVLVLVLGLGYLGTLWARRKLRKG